jgi:ribosomal protein L13E
MSLFTRRQKSEAKTPKPGRRAPKIIAPANLDGRKTVAAVGFSKLELERAGLTEEAAERYGLRVDRDRCSALGDNVAMLQRLLENG